MWIDLKITCIAFSDTTSTSEATTSTRATENIQEVINPLPIVDVDNASGNINMLYFIIDSTNTYLYTFIFSS